MSEAPDRRFGAVILGALGLGVSALAGAGVIFWGSSAVAQSFAEGVRAGQAERVDALCAPELRPRLDRASLAWLREGDGAVEVERGVAGFWHEGFVPYACHELRGKGHTAWVILLKREGAWRVSEVAVDQQPYACEPEP